MKKPQKKKVEHWDYHECADYISYKLGYDLRDTLGKWSSIGLPKKDVECRDFWHYLCHNNEINNPCYINISSVDSDRAEDWQAEIINAFVLEFGDNQEYWVEW